MKLKTKRPLAKGQVWKTQAANIQIMLVGKRLIHYKITNQLGMRRVSTQISGIEAMENYLQANKARLVGGPSTN